MLILYYYILIPPMFLLVDCSSIRGRNNKNELVPLSSRLDRLENNNHNNNMKVVSNEPFIIQLHVPKQNDSRRTEKDKKRKRPAKKRISKLRKKHRTRRDLLISKAKHVRDEKPRPLEIPHTANGTEVQVKNTTRNTIDRVEMLKALSSHSNKRQNRRSKHEAVEENRNSTQRAKLVTHGRSGQTPLVKMIYPSTPKLDRHSHKYTNKDLIADRKRLEQKINYIKNMLSANDSIPDDAVRIRRRSESDKTANKIAKMFLTLSAVNGLHDKRKKCKEEEDDDGDRVQDVWETERRSSPNRRSSSSNAERYKVKKWIEFMKNKRSSGKTCPCMSKLHGEDSDAFPLEQKLPKDYFLMERSRSSEESSETYREPYYNPRDKSRRRYNKAQDENKLKAIGKNGKKKIDLPLTDLELYRSRAKQILQNAEDILDKIKEEEEKRLAAPSILMSQLKELTSRIQSDPRNNENDLIRKIQKNLGWKPLAKSKDDPEGNAFIDNVKSYILDPYEKAKALTDESTRMLSSYLLRNLAKIQDSSEEHSDDDSVQGSENPQVYFGQVPTRDGDKPLPDSLAKEGSPPGDLLSKTKQEMQNWEDTISTIMQGPEETDPEFRKKQQEMIKNRMEDIIKEQQKIVNGYETSPDNSRETDRPDGRAAEGKLKPGVKPEKDILRGLASRLKDGNENDKADKLKHPIARPLKPHKKAEVNKHPLQKIPKPEKNTLGGLASRLKQKDGNDQGKAEKPKHPIWNHLNGHKNSKTGKALQGKSAKESDIVENKEEPKETEELDKQILDEIIKTVNEKEATAMEHETADQQGAETVGEESGETRLRQEESQSSNETPLQVSFNEEGRNLEGDDTVELREPKLGEEEVEQQRGDDSGVLQGIQKIMEEDDHPEIVLPSGLPLPDSDSEKLAETIGSQRETDGEVLPDYDLLSVDADAAIAENVKEAIGEAIEALDDSANEETLLQRAEIDIDEKEPHLGSKSTEDKLEDAIDPLLRNAEQLESAILDRVSDFENKSTIEKLEEVIDPLLQKAEELKSEVMGKVSDLEDKLTGNNPQVTDAVGSKDPDGDTEAMSLMKETNQESSEHTGSELKGDEEETKSRKSVEKGTEKINLKLESQDADDQSDESEEDVKATSNQEENGEEVAKSESKTLKEDDDDDDVEDDVNLKKQNSGENVKGSLEDDESPETDDDTLQAKKFEKEESLEDSEEIPLREPLKKAGEESGIDEASLRKAPEKKEKNEESPLRETLQNKEENDSDDKDDEEIAVGEPLKNKGSDDEETTLREALKKKEKDDDNDDEDDGIALRKSLKEGQEDDETLRKTSSSKETGGDDEETPLKEALGNQEEEAPLRESLNKKGQEEEKLLRKDMLNKEEKDEETPLGESLNKKGENDDGMPLRKALENQEEMHEDDDEETPLREVLSSKEKLPLSKTLKKQEEMDKNEDSPLRESLKGKDDKIPLNKKLKNQEEMDEDDDEETPLRETLSSKEKSNLPLSKKLKNQGEMDKDEDSTLRETLSSKEKLPLSKKLKTQQMDEEDEDSPLREALNSKEDKNPLTKASKNQEEMDEDDDDETPLRESLSSKEKSNLPLSKKLKNQGEMNKDEDSPLRETLDSKGDKIPLNKKSKNQEEMEDDDGTPLRQALSSKDKDKIPLSKKLKNQGKMDEDSDEETPLREALDSEDDKNPLTKASKSQEMDEDSDEKTPLRETLSSKDDKNPLTKALKSQEEIDEDDENSPLREALDSKDDKNPLTKAAENKEQMDEDSDEETPLREALDSEDDKNPLTKASKRQEMDEDSDEETPLREALDSKDDTSPLTKISKSQEMDEDSEEESPLKEAFNNKDKIPLSKKLKNQEVDEDDDEETPLRKTLTNQEEMDEDGETPLREPLKSKEDDDGTPLRESLTNTENDAPLRKAFENEEDGDTLLREKDGDEADDSETPLRATLENEEENDVSEDTQLREALTNKNEETPSRESLESKEDETPLQKAIQNTDDDETDDDETLRMEMENKEEIDDSDEESPLKETMQSTDEDETLQQVPYNTASSNKDDSDKDTTLLQEANTQLEDISSSEEEETPLRESNNQKDPQNVSKISEKEASSEEDNSKPEMEENELQEPRNETPLQSTLNDKDTETDETALKAVNPDEKDSTELRNSDEEINEHQIPDEGNLRSENPAGEETSQEVAMNRQDEANPEAIGETVQKSAEIEDMESINDGDMALRAENPIGSDEMPRENLENILQNANDEARLREESESEENSVEKSGEALRAAFEALAEELEEADADVASLNTANLEQNSAEGMDETLKAAMNTESSEEGDDDDLKSDMQETPLRATSQDEGSMLGMNEGGTYLEEANPEDTNLPVGDVSDPTAEKTGEQQDTQVYPDGDKTPLRVSLNEMDGDKLEEARVKAENSEEDLGSGSLENELDSQVQESPVQSVKETYQPESNSGESKETVRAEEMPDELQAYGYPKDEETPLQSGRDQEDHSDENDLETLRKESPLGENLILQDNNEALEADDSLETQRPSSVSDILQMAEKPGYLKVPKSIGQIMKNLDGRDKDDVTSIESLNPDKIDDIIGKIDQQNLLGDPEVDCRKECACADEIDTRSRNIGRYEIVKDFLHWMKDLQLNRVLSDD